MDRDGTSPPPTDRFPELSRLVQKHRVCWEVWPEMQAQAGKALVQIGYHLQLFGVHDHPKRVPMPGCEECRLVYGDLRNIAEWITPRAETVSQYEVQLFDSKLRYARPRGYREEVSLSLKILHRGQLSAPVDECETKCLHAMERQLAELGAKKHSWR